MIIEAPLLCKLVFCLSVLFVGAGECGKSTILKQMKILHATGFSEEEKLVQRRSIFMNIIQCLYDIIEAMSVLGIHYQDEMTREIDAELIIKVSNQSGVREFSSDLYTACMNVWSDRGVQLCVARRNEFQLQDSIVYFMENLMRIADIDYSPTQDDILRCRIKTTGIVQTCFEITGLAFLICDVGGQRSERNKWIHQFEETHGVIFISAISEYDQTMREDNKTNRLRDSLDLFESTCNNKFLRKSSMILFLNKKDIFAEKLTHRPLTLAFPDYTGSNSFEDTTLFLAMQFSSLNKYAHLKKIYPHLTCATNTNQIKFVISSVVDIMISAQALRGGMT